MNANTRTTTRLSSGLAALSLLLAAGTAFAQSAVTLTATPFPATVLPDGQSVPMWGYVCSAPSGATCTAAGGQLQAAGAWQPPLIRMTGNQLNITLVNNLSFNSNKIPTSLMIVGQVGGGLDGTTHDTMASPAHAAQGTTWPGSLGDTAGGLQPIQVVSPGSGYKAGDPVSISGGGGSGATAVISAVNATGGIVSISVTNPGSNFTSTPTVTLPATGTGGAAQAAGVGSADSATFTPPKQGLRVRSFGTKVDAGSSATLSWNNLRPGTYLVESGTEPSIQGPMGLYAILIVGESDTTGAPLSSAYGQAYDADVPLLLSEIDPIQNAAVQQAVNTTGFSDQLVWSAQKGRCGDPTIHTCYPPAVNYSPLYYLVNGISFDRTNLTPSTVSLAAAGTQQNLVLRLVNAGLRMHVPSVVGSSMTLLAEDGNKLPGIPKIQNEVFLAAGKTYEVAIQPQVSATAGTYAAATYPVFDRALGLSTGGSARDGGMQVYLSVAGGGANAPASASVKNAGSKTYSCIAGATLAISDPTLGLLGGTTGANGVALNNVFTGSLTAGNLALQTNGTFTYSQIAGAGTCGGSFGFTVNGAAGVYTATINQCDAKANANCKLSTAAVAHDVLFISNLATRYESTPPGVLGANISNGSGLGLSAVLASPNAGVALNSDGSFTATNTVACPATITTPASGAYTPPAGSQCTTFQFQASNTQGTLSNTANATVVFLPGSGLAFNVYDAPLAKTLNGAALQAAAIGDYRWIIEEDKTFWVDPSCQVNSTGTRLDSFGQSTCAPLPVQSLGYNFHTSHMDVVAQGCTGPVSCESGQTQGGTPVACDIGNGTCRTDASQKTATFPKDVHLDPSKHYFVSILPGDSVNPTLSGSGGPGTDSKGNAVPFSISSVCGVYSAGSSHWLAGDAGAECGHEMGGAQVSPYQIAHTQAVSVNLQQIPLPTAKLSVLVFQDDNPLNGENDAGGGVDVLAPNEPGLGGFEIKLFDQAGGLGDNTGQITYDQFNQPVSNSLAGTKDPSNGNDACPITRRGDGLVGMIPTCPYFESDGVTASPLAGQVVVANLYPGLYEVQAYPAADRIGRGEQWLQTNTLDGGKPHEAFLKPNEPGYFQEFGPGGFHVSIGFANPKVINDRHAGVCPAGTTCNSTLKIVVSNSHMSRTPDQRTFGSGNYDHYAFSQCYVSVGVPDAEDFAFQPCDENGVATFTGMPAGTFKIAVFDQWNDIMLDGLVGSIVIDPSTPTASKTTTVNFPVTQWRTNLYTRTFIDDPASPNGVGTDDKAGLALVNTNIRYRDGSYGFYNNTDLSGYAAFNEVFPFMNWLVVETSTTRFKQNSVHTVYDAGGAVDGSPDSKNPNPSQIADSLANTQESVSLPANLRIPGARYCKSADCPTGDSTGGSTGVVVPAQPWGMTQAWQGLLGQNSFMEFGMVPFKPGENGGINGHVIYASTRPFDDPQRLLQLQWEPGVPHVKVNLYQETTDANGNQQLVLVDSTQTTSWDDWAQGFRPDGATPNMNCPGQSGDSPFFATLKNSTQWLDAQKRTLPSNSQFKCYDGWSQLNQIQPAPYDGMYKFPSVTSVSASGKFASSNCSGCVANPADGTAMLPPGKYVVEMVVPPGYELVKEEDKNILLGDVMIAPVTQQFAGFGNIFIMPDQAAVGSSYNASNPGGLNLTTDLGDTLHHEGDTGSIESFWPCVGAKRVVPDYNSLYPGAQQAAPFAGATRSLCDRKEVVVTDQSTVLAKFYVFTSAHVAGHFTGNMTNDFASEFDPFSPQFGEKFAPPNLPVALRDFNGDEVARVYSDQWGVYNGLYFSTWSVNPPNPTGYAPQMSIACMNDPGPIKDPNPISATFGQMITDPAYNPAYSNFCYEQPFMPGFTTYMDTPVIPTQAFADNYNLPDAEYPDHTPAILSVKGDVAGPWVAAAGGGNVVSAINVTTGGNYAGVPTVVIAGNGGATAVAVMNAAPLTGVTLNNRGTGYASAPAVTFTGGGGTGAAASTVLAVNAVNVTNGGRYTTAPTVTFDAPPCTLNGTTCVRALGTASLQGNGNNRRVGGVTVNTAGAGYAVAPGVTFSGTGGATATVTMSVSAIALTNGGSGYTSVPTVGIAAPAGRFNQTATATAQFSSSVASVAVTSGGAGYTAVPVVTFTGGAGSGAAATAALTATGTLTITALGDKMVQNPAFAGPNAATAPYNQKTIKRTYDFGTTAGTVSLVDASGVEHPLVNPSWSATSISGVVPADLPACPMQQRGTAQNNQAKCGELVITRGDNGKRSIDTVTVTIGGTAPWLVTPSGVTAPGGKSVKDYGTAFGRMGPSPIQVALDSATPGDLVLVGPGSYRENVIMWKPVRLQGVGAASVTVNADAHPAGKMDQWRRQITCVFGLDINGWPNINDATYDASGAYSCPRDMFQRVDRIPFEAIIGWDAAGNGNLAQVLQEPTLMGAYEGAGITVLGRGVRIPANSRDFWGQNATGGAGAFTDGSVYLGNSNQDCAASTTQADGRDYGTGNYYCNPSRIDGISLINSSQGGGGAFIHGWGHNLEVANTRIQGNHGTLAGGINLGNGETPDVYLNDGVECGVNLVGAAAVQPCPPIPQGTVTNAAIPFAFNTHVRLHHNMIYDNASIGDALFSGTPAGAGAITVSAGADDYQIDHNWIAGNLSTGDGGGLQHLGLSFRGKMNNNFILFNQSTNPTLPTNGGGVVLEGANLDRTIAGQECGSTNDVDCSPGLGDGTGPGIVFDANLLLGNSAESGSGGGLRLQQMNGSEAVEFNNRPDRWYDVTVTNNIIVNNVAGWDGGGISMQDTLKASIINNTIASNDTTATAGALFKTLGAINAASAPPGCSNQGNGGTSLNCADPNNAPHQPQPAGLVVQAHTPNLVDAFATVQLNCPSDLAYGYAAGDCKKVSKPRLVNDLFWQNRAFQPILSAAPTTGLLTQQVTITMAPQLNQGASGACMATDGNGGALPDNFFWDIGIRTNDVGAGLLTVADNKLAVSNSVYSGDVQGVIVGTSNQLPAKNATLVVAQYCNGARVPPEYCGAGGTSTQCNGYNAPPGASETTTLAQAFTFNNIKPTATVDEGNNWLNLSYGPLTLSKPNLAGGVATGEVMLAAGATGTNGGAYSPTPTSPAVAAGTGSVVSPNNTLARDFYGNTRTGSGRIDIGAVECQGTACVGSGNGGGGSTPPGFPTLGLLDNFNRANANTLGGNWKQVALFGNASVRVNTQNALSMLDGVAYWNATANFGAKQAAQIDLVGGNVNNEGLILKANTPNNLAPNAYNNAIRVRYVNGTIVVDHTINASLSYTGAVTIANAGTLVTGNSLTALVDATGTVYVWKTVNGTVTYLGQAASGVTGTGAIGVFVPNGERVDNFNGGAVP